MVCVSRMVGWLVGRWASSRSREEQKSKPSNKEKIVVDFLSGCVGACFYGACQHRFGRATPTIWSTQVSTPLVVIFVVAASASATAAAAAPHRKVGALQVSDCEDRIRDR